MAASRPFAVVAPSNEPYCEAKLSMLRNFFTIVFCYIFLTTVPLLGYASNLADIWKLKVQNLQKQGQVIASIRLTEKPAQSCMGGNWKVVIVESVSKKVADFFPISEPLAYEIRDGRLTIGRTEVCDAYLFLTGPLTDHIQGEYSVVSIGGSQKLGTFTLKR